MAKYAMAGLHKWRKSLKMRRISDIGIVYSVCQYLIIVIEIINADATGNGNVNVHDQYAFYPPFLRMATAAAFLKWIVHLHLLALMWGQSNVWLEWPLNHFLLLNLNLHSWQKA
jgi:hypothetical protein